MAAKLTSFRNTTRDTVVASSVRVADSFFTRLAGLLFSKPLVAGEGLLIKPCPQIHMIGMKFAIDALFLDKQSRVVATLEDFKPGRISPYYKQAKSCLELPVGAIASSGTVIGDVLEMQ